jgi:uncharacterized protein YpiB (UPF0302 family)
VRKTTYKKDFFNYVLYHYEFEDRAAVWILNFIKSHPVISQNITFNQKQTKRKLRIAESRTKRPTLVFEKEGVITTDGEVIFHELNLNQDTLIYIELSFLNYDERYEKVKEDECLEYEQLLQVEIEQLETAIDAALKAKDKPLFMELTKELQQIKTGE